MVRTTNDLITTTVHHWPTGSWFLAQTHDGPARFVSLSQTMTLPARNDAEMLTHHSPSLSGGPPEMAAFLAIIFSLIL